jgi:hypothetical protein
VTPCMIISMPGNGRCRLYADDPVDEDDGYAVPICTDFVDLPIPMPTVADVTTGNHGRPIAVYLPEVGKWVRKQDVAMVMLGIAQYNRDLVTRDEARKAE